ncbi:MAG: DNA polymerase/3'-5' exonuclease PolX [Anaerolineales bacterium]
MDNHELADKFDAIADLLEIKGEEIYRIRAYRRASEGLRSHAVDAQDLQERGELEEIPGVGKAIAEKIDELLRTGDLEFYKRLTAEVPPSLLEVLEVENVGPKKAARFWKELGVETLEDLETAAREERIREMDGFGAKSEGKILAAIDAYKKRDHARILISDAEGLAVEFVRRIRALEGVLEVEAAGSLRRSRETIGDLDIVVAATNPQKVIESFLTFPEIQEIRAQGDVKASVLLSRGLRLQLWVHPPDRFGSALQYATGSQLHNVRLRELAHKQGLSLSEHGFMRDDGIEILCAEETDVYAALGLPWIPPPLREDRGEIAAALADDLPELVSSDDVRGELHAHSDWSDGKVSIEEMCIAALGRGLSYLAITDHSRSLGIAGGLSIEDLKKQRVEIDRVQKRMGDDLNILQGAEVEILREGGLDYPDSVLAELDIVIASLHMGLRQPRDKVTARILSAIENPYVDMIGHLTGRLIGRRDPADLDIEPIFQAAADRGVILEINSNPERLDLKDIHVRRAVELGCLTAINTDAHHPDHLDFRDFGIGTARRGWVEGGSVANTWKFKEVEKWLKRKSRS